MSDFKVGDVVYLNSGSPKLTITYIGSDDKPTVHVVWMAGEHNVHIANFPAACLRARCND